MLRKTSQNCVYYDKGDKNYYLPQKGKLLKQSNHLKVFDVKNEAKTSNVNGNFFHLLHSSTYIYSSMYLKLHHSMSDYYWVSVNKSYSFSVKKFLSRFYKTKFCNNKKEKFIFLKWLLQRMKILQLHL